MDAMVGLSRVDSRDFGAEVGRVGGLDAHPVVGLLRVGRRDCWPVRASSRKRPMKEAWFVCRLRRISSCPPWSSFDDEVGEGGLWESKHDVRWVMRCMRCKRGSAFEEGFVL